VIYNNPGIVEYGDFYTETLPILKSQFVSYEKIVLLNVVTLCRNTSAPKDNKATR
jgi:hypothetical protein